jgi:hypothetical protein
MGQKILWIKDLLQYFSLFLCWEIIGQTYVVIITIKSMFSNSMQYSLYCSNFPELKQNKYSSYIRCLWYCVTQDTQGKYCTVCCSCLSPVIYQKNLWPRKRRFQDILIKSHSSKFMLVSPRLVQDFRRTIKIYSCADSAIKLFPSSLLL